MKQPERKPIAGTFCYMLCDCCKEPMLSEALCPNCQRSMEILHNPVTRQVAFTCQECTPLQWAIRSHDPKKLVHEIHTNKPSRRLKLK